ncbi:MAG: hypothetical protein HY286_12875 [Planctomycetes bacterium]|nr:hypothetical protein [Planctomycetota bacterium]
MPPDDSTVESNPEDSPHDYRPVARELVQVYSGRLGEVIAMRAALAASGFETFVQDELTKSIDPYMTGGNAFEVYLLAGRDDAPAIRSWLNEMEGTPGRGEPNSVELEKQLKELEKLGERVRWCTLDILQPLGVYLGMKYLARVQSLGIRPKLYNSTLAAFTWNIVCTIFYCIGIYAAVVIVLKL